MQYELKALQRDVGITFIYVTHDQEEAITMADRIAVMNEGVMLQVGTPREIYEHPARTSSPTSSARPISSPACCSSAEPDGFGEVQTGRWHDHHGAAFTIAR